MARPRSEKMAAAEVLWHTMPSAKLKDFVKTFKKQHGQSISTPGAYLAKKRAGLTKSSNKSSKAKVIGIEQLKEIHQLAKDIGGIKEVRRQLKMLAPIAKAAGGYDQLERCLEMIEELKQS
jgi:Zn-dependent M16 (insulinase) family peptidase